MWKRILIIITAVFALIYLLGTLLFFGRYPMRTTVDGINATYKTPGEVSLELMRRTQNQSIEFIVPDGDNERLIYEQLGIFRASEMEEANNRVNPFLWPLSFFRDTEYHLDQELSYNPTTLRNCLSQLLFVKNGTIPPEDAYVEKAYDGSFYIVEDKIGTVIDLDMLETAVLKSISNKTYTVDVAAENCYQLADVQKEDENLIVFRDKANSVRELKIDLDLGDGTDMVIPQEVLDRLTFVEDEKIGFSFEKIQEYVAELAEKYDTYGQTRVFHTSTGEDVEVAAGDTTVCGFTGWELDQESLCNTLFEAFSACRDANVSLPWLHRGVAHGEQNDFGDTYVELSIDNQHMWFYENGVCTCETDVVTGTETDASRRTPRGVWRSTDLYREHTMTGSYGSAFCHYFIRVTLDGVGIHDASWRSSYGGTHYLYDGSHGCINTPFDAVQYIFEAIKKREMYTPIIIW